MEEPKRQPLLHGTDSRETRIMAKIRDSLLSQASAFNPSVIERRIQELFNSFNTPTHPPYALMIQRAVMELNEGNGSTEEEISEFIKKEFEDLPWAHTRILGLHLRRLCQAEELLCTRSGRYMLMDECGNFGAEKETVWRGSKRKKRRKKGRNHRGGERNKTLKRTEGTERSNGLQEQENQEQNQLSVLHGTGANEMIEKLVKSEIGLLGMNEECRGRVAQAQGEAEKPQNGTMDERIQESIMELNDKISLSETLNTESPVAEEQHSMVIEKHIQCEKQSYDLLEVAENQTQQIEVTPEISRFCSDENSNRLSASLVGPTIALIPKENLQILEQEEQQQNVTPSIQQKFSGACELLVDQEDPISHLETCSSQPKAPDLPVVLASNFLTPLTAPGSIESLEYYCTPSARIQLTPTQLQLQISKCGVSETHLYAASKMSASLSSMTVHEHKQPQNSIHESPKGRLDENMTFGDLGKHPPKPQGRGRGRGRGRPPKLDGNPHKYKKQLKLQDQALGPVSFPNLEWKEAIHSSQPAPNLPVVVTPNHLQQLGDPISEGSCIPSLNEEESSIQLQLRRYWEGLIGEGLGTASKMEASLYSMNVHENKPQQQGNKGSPKRKLDIDEKTDFVHLKQQPTKCQHRGRPPTPKPVEDNSGVSLLLPDESIYSEKNSNFYSSVKQRQLQLRGRGRGSGRGKGHGRPPKLNCGENNCKLWPQDQAQGKVHSTNLPDCNNESWEQKQLQLRCPAETKGRHPKLESGVGGSCQKQLFLPQSSSLGRGKRELLNARQGHQQPLNARQGHQQLLPETCEGQGRRLLRSSSTKPSPDAS